MITRTSWPTAASALGREPMTSARPPVFAKGAASAAMKRIRSGLGIVARGPPDARADRRRPVRHYTPGVAGRYWHVRAGAFMSHPMKPIREIAEGLTIPDEYVQYYGRYTAKLRLELLAGLSARPTGKPVLGTAIAPPSHGEATPGRSFGLAQR